MKVIYTGEFNVLRNKALCLYENDLFIKNGEELKYFKKYFCSSQVYLQFSILFMNGDFWQAHFTKIF